MHHQYPNCPVREALVEFYFDSDAPWDDTYTGLFYQEVSAEYPTKEQRITNAASLQQDGPQPGMKFEFSQRFIAKRADGAALIQLSPNLLVVNVLLPYGGWETLRDRAESALNVYKTVCAPSGLKSIGLRYLNRLEIPSGRVDLDDYFTLHPEMPDEGPLAFDMGAFAVMAEYPYAEGRDVLRLDMRSTPDQEPTKLSIAYDLYYRSTMLGSAETEVVMAWLESAHDAVSAAFEATLTDATRAILNGEN